MPFSTENKHRYKAKINKIGDVIKMKAKCIGLLPLYIELYDRSGREKRNRMYDFYQKIVSKFEAQGFRVITSDFCRLRSEFEETIANFEAEGADALITLHMAYSPSLESIDALCATKLPIIVLDTTETLEFTNEQDSREITYNHGIHGVMDMCSMLKRRGKPYAILAGYYEESGYIERACGYVRAASVLKALNGAHVGLIGGSFDGMGDFCVEPSELKERFGICVEDVDPDIWKTYYKYISDQMLQSELEENRARFQNNEELSQSDYENAVKNCLALRQFLQQNQYTAFSINFRNVREIPFIECCKAMERGIGYAGEGDGLTSAFAGAIMSAYPNTSFVEIFCPDWKNDTLFLSHMGEVNYRITKGKLVLCKKGGFVDTYAAYAPMMGGKGVYMNISRGKDNYQMFLSSADMLEYPTDNFEKYVRGWMKPSQMTTAEFLEAHSKHGATHHSIFVYDATVEELSFLGQLLGMDVVSL